MKNKKIRHSKAGNLLDYGEKAGRGRVPEAGSMDLRLRGGSQAETNLGIWVSFSEQICEA